MVKRRTTESLPEPSELVDRAAEAASDAGDLGAELLSTGVDAATSLVSRFTSVPEERMKPPRRHAQKASGTTSHVQRSGATVKRAAEAAARDNRKLVRKEASAGKNVANVAKKTGRKVAKAAKPSKKK